MKFVHGLKMTTPCVEITGATTVKARGVIAQSNPPMTQRLLQQIVKAIIMTNFDLPKDHNMILWRSGFNVGYTLTLRSGKNTCDFFLPLYLIWVVTCETDDSVFFQRRRLNSSLADLCDSTLQSDYGFIHNQDEHDYFAQLSSSGE